MAESLEGSVPAVTQVLFDPGVAPTKPLYR